MLEFDVGLAEQTGMLEWLSSVVCWIDTFDYWT